LFDHTLLKPEATPDQIRALCAEAGEHRFMGVCVNPCYVALATRELERYPGPRPLLTMAVVGFPLGANRTDVKIDETLRATADGAREIDMVINVGLYLGGEKAAARHDMQGVVRAAQGAKAAVKVILETGFLTKDQIAEWCLWCREAGAALVKTSTGFGPRGASIDDVQVMAATLSSGGGIGQVGIKASGGIRTLEQAEAMVQAGATRIGSSASVKILADFRASSGGAKNGL
jgi:deoxyribose-phosphate aldolase